MANKVGKLIKEARTDAGFTQEQLAKKVKGVSAADISSAERGELKLTQENLKAIAKATGVTQSSLIEAATNSTYKSGSSKSAKKSSTSSKSTKKSGSAKSGSTKSSSSTTSMKLTSTEKKLVELYRDADTETRKEAMKILKSTDDDGLLSDLLGSLLNNSSKKNDNLLESLLSSTKKSSKKDDILSSLLGGGSSKSSDAGDILDALLSGDLFK